MKQMALLILLLRTISAAQQWRVMPMGDSITFGVGYSGGYRCLLGSLLGRHGIQLVGPMHDFCGGFAGFAGKTLQQIANQSKDAMAAAHPDVVVLQAGTNDFYFKDWPAYPGLGANVSVAAERLESLLDDLYDASSNLTVALSTVTEINTTLCSTAPAPCPADMASNIASFNAMLPYIVAMQQAKSRRIVLHDINAASKWAAGDNSNDGIHFSQEGYVKIARAWWSSLLPLAPPELGSTTTTTTSSRRLRGC